MSSPREWKQNKTIDSFERVSSSSNSHQQKRLATSHLRPRATAAARPSCDATPGVASRQISSKVADLTLVASESRERREKMSARRPSYPGDNDQVDCPTSRAVRCHVITTRATITPAKSGNSPVAQGLQTRRRVRSGRSSISCPSVTGGVALSSWFEWGCFLARLKDGFEK